MSFDLKSVIGSVAPTLATMLGGPLAGTAVTALEGAFGVQPGSGTDAISQVVQAGGMTPEIMTQLRAADQKHAEALQEMDIDLQKLNDSHQEAMADEARQLALVDAQDRASARQREMSTKDYTTRVLAYIVILGWLGINGWVLTHELPVTMVAIIQRLLGTLDSMTMVVLAYYFGSSSSSARKTELLAQAQPVAANDPAISPRLVAQKRAA